MKRLLLCLILLIMILTISACSVMSAGDRDGGTADQGMQDSEDKIAVNNLWTVTDGITLRLLQDTYPPNPGTMTLVLENRSNSVMSYGQGWSFEKYKNGVWREMKTIENYGFTMEGYTLYDHDKKTFGIGTWFLKEPLSEGLYRVTGCELRVASGEPSLRYGMVYVEYPSYQLEFRVSKSATEEPAEIPEKQLAKWQLPDIEDWQWYTPRDGCAMYEDAGMRCWQYVEGKNGLMAILYCTAKENDNLNTSDLLLLDLFDRKTGKRYPVFTEPAIESETVSAYKDGFKIDRGDLLYCFINDEDRVVTESLY